MTGRTGYTAPTNASDFDVPGDIAAVYAHFDSKIGAAAYSNVGDLPSSGNYNGRLARVNENDALYMHDGTAWEVVYRRITSYTPSVTGISGGTVAGRYMRVGNLINVRIKHTLPSGGGVSGQPTYTLPSTARDADIEWLDGTALFDNAGGGGGSEYLGIVRKQTATTVSPYAQVATGTYTAFANVSATAPFTWALNDLIIMNFSYWV